MFYFSDYACHILEQYWRWHFEFFIGKIDETLESSFAVDGAFLWIFDFISVTTTTIKKLAISERQSISNFVHLVLNLFGGAFEFFC
jgi:hypothetical protein